MPFEAGFGSTPGSCTTPVFGTTLGGTTPGFGKTPATLGEEAGDPPELSNDEDVAVVVPPSSRRSGTSFASSWSISKRRGRGAGPRLLCFGVCAVLRVAGRWPTRLGVVARDVRRLARGVLLVAIFSKFDRRNGERVLVGCRPSLKKEIGFAQLCSPPPCITTTLVVKKQCNAPMLRRGFRTECGAHRPAPSIEFSLL
jgi:hypothetical protein